MANFAFKICPYCSATFTPTCGHQEYCSPKHQRHAYRAAKREQRLSLLVACAVCGRKTESRLGVCTTTPECIREHERRRRPTQPNGMCDLCGRDLGWPGNYGVCSRTPDCLREWNRRNRVERRKEPVTALKDYLTNLRARARAADVPFALTIENLPPIPDECPALGIPFKHGHGVTGSLGPHAPSLDRIIPDLGYVPGNVQWISFKANTMKNDSSMDELRRFAHWALNLSASHLRSMG